MLNIRHAVMHMVVMMIMIMVMIVVMVVIMVIVMVMVVMMIVTMVVVVIMMVIVHVFVFLGAVYGDGHVSTRDTALYRRFDTVTDIGDPDSIKFSRDPCGIRKQFDQSRREHISRCAHGTVKIDRFHSFCKASI